MHSTADKGWVPWLHELDLQPQTFLPTSRLLAVETVALLHSGCRTWGLLLAVCAWRNVSRRVNVGCSANRSMSFNFSNSSQMLALALHTKNCLHIRHKWDQMMFSSPEVAI